MIFLHENSLVVLFIHPLLAAACGCILKSVSVYNPVVKLSLLDLSVFLLSYLFAFLMTTIAKLLLELLGRMHKSKRDVQKSSE